MAHHADGSSIQKHGAGSHYPFVVGVQEFSTLGFAYVQSPDGTQSVGYSFPIIVDGIDDSKRAERVKGLRLDAYAKAFTHAGRMAKALREVQAWAAEHKPVVAAHQGWHAQVTAGGDAGLVDFE